MSAHQSESLVAIIRILAELLVTTRGRLNDEYLDERGIMENVLVFNNACWAIGEIGHKIP